MYNVDDLKQVFIGRRGEGNARVIEIDVSGMLREYPDAAYSVIMKRSDSDVPIRCETVLNGSVLAWMITPVCTSVAGVHPFEVQAVEAGMTVKSRTGYALVAYAVADYAGEDYPDEIQTWIDALQEKIEEIAVASTADDLAYILGV